MAQKEVLMPRMGESVMEGTILQWLKKPGDTIEEEESLVEIATDKVDTEIPAPFAGKIIEYLVKEGDVVEVDSPIAIMEVEGAVADAPAKAETPASETKSTTKEAPQQVTTIAQPVNASSNGIDARFYSPLVLNMAKKESIARSELETIPGSGKDNRVTKQDMLAYIKNRGTQKTVEEDQILISPNMSLNGQDEIIEMSRLRKIIAGRMLESKRISPHVTSFVEADMTNIVLWRGKIKNEFKERENTILTYTPIIIEAIAKAIKDYPMINVSVDGDKIIKHNYINIGMAVALPDGDLIVPVIKNVDQLNIVGITKQVNDLAKRARNGQLKPEDLEGGTYTVSNVGSFGNVMGTPIIVQPQVGIMANGAIIKKPAVVETPQGDTIGIRHKMFLSHSYDHRVVDGSLGGMFVRRVADYLEGFDMNRVVWKFDK
ncbi:MAG: dihydrolipoamide acetyltransferase family protein [Cyclobacteriaceae bacterium]